MAYGARLESVLGESPRGFESPILRRSTKQSLTQHSPSGATSRRPPFWFELALEVLLFTSICSIENNQLAKRGVTLNCFPAANCPPVSSGGLA